MVIRDAHSSPAEHRSRASASSSSRLELADRGGVEALSMRQGSGQELGVDAMALYRHVRNKDDLLDGLLARRSSAQIDHPTPGDDWKATVRARR